MTAALPEKARRRAEALARRDALSLDDRLDWDEAIAARALALAAWGEGPVAGYWPIRSEADPRPILEGLAARGLTLCLPAVTEAGLEFRLWPLWGPLAPGGFGTLAPPAGAEVIRPAVLIVPMAAFDRCGFRIGYGKGHYDQALSRLPGARTVGLAYAAQEIAEAPHEPHDHPLDVIITEREAIRP